MKVALLSCTKQKATETCTAKEMYWPSTLFKKAWTYVNSQGYDHIFIMSAKYGLLTPGSIIDPYDDTLNGAPKETLQRWSAGVANELLQARVTEAVFYAGDNYRKFLIPHLEMRDVICKVPLKGMGIGDQLGFYTRENAG